MDEKVLGSTVRIDLTTHDATGALVAPSSAFASDGSDFRIYKDGSASEKTTVNGITVTSPFDSITGKHLIEIDTNNATGDSGFWAAGSEYRVEINSAKTVASIVQSGVTVGRFRLVSADVLRTLGTNAPADWLDAAAVKADAVTKIQTGLSTYAGGDTAGTTTLLARLTSTRAGLLDNLSNLDVAVSVIQAQITALNNLSAKANWFGYPLLEVPDAGTRAYVFELIVRDDEDKLVNLDSSPTIALVNAAGTDRSALITTGVANPSTGRYTITITVGTATTNESLKLTATGAIGAETRYASFGTQVVDYDTATLINQILTTLGTAGSGLTAIGDARLDNLDAEISSRLAPTVAGRTLNVSAGGEGDAELNATALRAAVGLADANIDEQFGDLMTAVTDVQTDVDANTGYLTALTTNMTTLLGRVTSQVYTMWTDLIAMITGSGATPKFTTSALSNAPTGSGGGGGGGDALLSNQVIIISHLVDIKGSGWSSSTDSLEKIREAVDIGESLIGPGSDFCTMEIKDDGVAVESASVWISTDSSGDDVIAGTLPTNGLGQVRFLLTAGATYYLWANKAGKISIQGEPFVAVAD